MTQAINNLFEAATQSSTTGTKTLTGTVRLTEQASLLVNKILDAVNTDPEEYSRMVIESQRDIPALDKLVAIFVDTSVEPIEWLKEIVTADLESMLKSQQSKKSRTRGKEMTLENYKSMLNAAISEELIRGALGKAKAAGGNRSESVAYTEERLVELANDQEALRKEIRNVQSKKSIMKSKAGYTEEDERWQALLIAEKQLKSIRVAGGTTTTFVSVDEVKNYVIELLGEVDVNKLTKADAVEFLKLILFKAMDDEEEEEVADDAENEDDAEGSEQ